MPPMPKPSDERARPADARPLVQGVGDRRQAEAREHEAGDVERAGRRLLVLAQEAQPERHRGDAERHVDEEDPAPAERLGEQAAEHRAERRRDERRDHHDRRGARPLDRRERPEQHGDADRREHAAADALQDAERRRAGRSSGRTRRARTRRRTDRARSGRPASSRSGRPSSRSPGSTPRAPACTRARPTRSPRSANSSPIVRRATLTIVVSSRSRNSADTNTAATTYL